MYDDGSAINILLSNYPDNNSPIENRKGKCPVGKWKWSAETNANHSLILKGNSYFKVLFQNSDWGLKLILYIFHVGFVTFWSFLQGFWILRRVLFSIFEPILETSIYRNSHIVWLYDISFHLCWFVLVN